MLRALLRLQKDLKHTLTYASAFSLPATLLDPFFNILHD